MILKKESYWFGMSEKDSVGIYENNDGSFTVFYTNKKTNKTSVLECKGCDLDECIRTANRVFKTYTCIEN